MASFRSLDPRFRPWAEALFQVAQQNRLRPKLTSAYRSMRKQNYLYQRYLEGRHPFPVAPPGSSLHNYGLAIDMVTLNNDALGRAWMSVGGRYGGKKDWVHFSV